MSILVMMMCTDIVGKPVRWIRRVIRQKKEMSVVIEAHSKEMEAILEMHRKQMEAICAWNADELDLTFKRYNIGLALVFERFIEQLEAAFVGMSQEAAPTGPCSQRTEPQVMKDMPHLFPIKGGILLDDSRDIITTAPSPPKPCSLQEVSVQDLMATSDDDTDSDNNTEHASDAEIERNQYQETNDKMSTLTHTVDNPMLAQVCTMKDRGLAWALREAERYTDDEEELEREAEQARQRAAREEKMRIKQSLRHQVKQMPRYRKSNYKMNRTFFAPI